MIISCEIGEKRGGYFRMRRGKRYVAGICCLMLLFAAMLSGCQDPTQDPPAGESGSGDVADGSEEGSGGSSATIPVANPGEIALVAGEASGSPGDFVTIPVAISANSYLVNADLEIHYDTSRLRLVSQYDEELGDEMLVGVGIWSDMLTPSEIAPGTVHVALVKAGAGIQRGGDLFTLRFEIIGELETPAAISLEAQVVMTNTNSSGTDIDALAAGLVEVRNGQVAAG